MSPQRMRAAEVADGVFLVEHGFANCYLIIGDDAGGGVTLIDSGLPRGYRALAATMRWLGRGMDEIRALLLTHGHFDHVGTARHLSEEYRVPIWVHPEDRYMTRHPYHYPHEAPRFAYPFSYPQSLPILASMTAAGALNVRGADATNFLQDGVSVTVPGLPVPIATPGHTPGHCAFHLPDRGVLITGDAMVTLDPYTGERGPRIVARAATADSAQALASLDALAATDATVLLPGHGEPWRQNVREAMDAARAAGTP
ncbi:MBL fold metallo-hydrolase [Rathayibacter sp. YIM 133350]|uniref:MBL fold metallo-hydrolase n=1 Tax=Rathayibacter sp. YIM 133350 TaxID=3131992 RepID=UPI00307DE80F